MQCEVFGTPRVTVFIGDEKVDQLASIDFLNPVFFKNRSCSNGDYNHKIRLYVNYLKSFQHLKSQLDKALDKSICYTQLSLKLAEFTLTGFLEHYKPFIEYLDEGETVKYFFEVTIKGRSQFNEDKVTQ